MPSKEYHIGRTRAANCRLNLQNHLLDKSFKHELDPKIQPSPLTAPNLTIADLCCDTGHWLLSLQQEVDHSTELHAFDITLANLPPQPWTPRIHRHPYNIYDPPPAKFKGYFDIVNIAMVTMFVDDAQIHAVLPNIIAFVKPGGYLQFSECDFANVDVFSPYDLLGAQPRFVGNELLMQFMGMVDKTPPNWAPVLDEMLAEPERGLEMVSVLRPEPNYPWLWAWNEHYFSGFEEILGAMENVPGEKKRKVEEYREVLENAYKEFREEGMCMWIRVFRYVARKK